MKKTHINPSSFVTFYRYGHRVLCADGIIRSVELAPTADSFFSVRATLRVKGKRVTGYVTTDDMMEEPEYTFRPVDSEKEAHPHLVWAPRISPPFSGDKLSMNPML